MNMLACALLFAALSVSAAPVSYHVAAPVQIGGEGGWDYLTVDPEAQRIYVSHATRVEVVDLAAGKVMGAIPDTPGVHGIALAPKLGRGYVSSGRANSVTVFDLKTLKTIEQIAVGQNPDSILYDSVSNRVFTFNGRSKDASVIDAASGKVVSTIPLGGKPEFSVSDDKGKVWVNIEDTHEMAEIDAAKAVVTKRYNLDGCEDPSGLAIDRAHRRLFSVCGNKVMTISDPDAGKVVAHVPIGEGSDGAGFDPGTGLAFSSNGEGTLTVVQQNAGKYEVAQTVTTERGARTMAVDPTTHNVYLPTARFGPAPAATPQQPRPRPAPEPGSFHLVVVSQ